MKNIEIEEILKSLKSIQDERVPVRTGMVIATDIKRLTAAHETYTEERNRIIKSYAPEGGDSIKPDDPGYAQCARDVAELGALDADVDLRLIPMDSVADLKLTMAQITALGYIIEDDTGE